MRQTLFDWSVEPAARRPIGIHEPLPAVWALEFLIDANDLLPKAMEIVLQIHHMDLGLRIHDTLAPGAAAAQPVANGLI